MSEMNSVEIDPNIRVFDNLTYVDLDDFLTFPYKGEEVEVYKSESGLFGYAKVVSIDYNSRIVYLDVEWDELTVEECGEMYYGHLDKGAIHMSWSVPRWCNKPHGHKGDHWYDKNKEYLDGHE